jgi:hypothetical protein
VCLWLCPQGDEEVKDDNTQERANVSAFWSMLFHHGLAPSPKTGLERNSIYILFIF